jgi:hypothetical protein
MTVNELIEKLNQIENKELEVVMDVNGDNDLRVSDVIFNEWPYSDKLVYLVDLGD